MSATALIVALIVVFIGVFPAEGGVVPFDLTIPVPVLGSLTLTDLGLTTLTGFATLNLLLPLSIVNIALIYSRRRYPDIERGFRVPGVPLLPVIGVIANVALIYNLPIKGVIVGVSLVLSLLGAYLVWGGAPDVEESYEQVVPPTTAPAPTEAPSGGAAERGSKPTPGAEDAYRVLVARPERAARYIKLAATLGKYQGKDPFIQVLTVTEIPEQTPHEAVEETARGRVQRIQELLADENLDVEYAVEGHTCRDVAFDIVQTARNDDADLILMGYPEEHTQVAERVEYKAPCGVMFASGVLDPTGINTINVGSGGGPHHMDLLSLVERMGEQGGEIHVINITPEGGPGRPENTEATISGLSNAPSVQVHNLDAQTVADGLVEQATENGGILLIGATRTRRLRRRVFGSTPDNVIQLAQGTGLPVLVYASPRGCRARSRTISIRFIPTSRADGGVRAVRPEPAWRSRRRSHEPGARTVD
jgi:nucleotide-binding universal stress UspA family protein